jgi:DNA-binding NtrC family response regulator
VRSTGKAKILIVDDDPDIVTTIQDRLEWLGYETEVAADGLRALECIERSTPDLMLLDMEMPRLAGLELLKRLAKYRQQGEDAYALPVVVLTAHGTIAKAVEAMKEGAYDFLTKPFDADHLSLVIRKALERESLKRQVTWLRTEVEARYAAVIGSSVRIQAVIEQTKRAAGVDANVLLTGESGTGKELLARSLHRWSDRRTMPLVIINCAALTDSLMENELFGHEKGAFTGADHLQKGKIEVADGGTVFLDEVGDIPLTLQAKLLRVLQDHEFHRIGGTRLVRVNIRVVAATNKDLKQAVKAGQFREDLFFRLNVVTITLPPLRERPEDIPPLAEHFLVRHANDAKRPRMRLTDEAMAALIRHPWPGNIRELENTIARAVVFSPHDVLGPEQLGLAPAEGLGSADPDRPAGYEDLPYHDSIEQHIRYLIRRALRRANGNQTLAAAQLKLQRTYLARLIRKKHIALHDSREE